MQMTTMELIQLITVADGIHDYSRKLFLATKQINFFYNEFPYIPMH